MASKICTTSVVSCGALVSNSRILQLHMAIFNGPWSNTFERCQDVTDVQALQCVPKFIFQHGSKSWPSWRSKKSKHWNLVIPKFLFPSISLMSLAHGTAPRRGCGVKYISAVEFWSIFTKKPFTFKIRPQRLNIGLFPSTLASFHYIFFKIDKCTAAPEKQRGQHLVAKPPDFQRGPFRRFFLFSGLVWSSRKGSIWNLGWKLERVSGFAERENALQGLWRHRRLRESTWIGALGSFAFGCLWYKGHRRFGGFEQTEAHQSASWRYFHNGWSR